MLGFCLMVGVGGNDLSISIRLKYPFRVLVPLCVLLMLSSKRGRSSWGIGIGDEICLLSPFFERYFRDDSEYRMVMHSV